MTEPQRRQWYRFHSGPIIGADVPAECESCGSYLKKWLGLWHIVCGHCARVLFPKERP